jgi:hypothetical protein
MSDNAANNDTFLKEFEKVCIENRIDFHHKRNHMRCIAHIMNLAVQEILKHIKAGEAQDEDFILQNFTSGTIRTSKVIPRIRSKNKKYYIISITKLMTLMYYLVEEAYCKNTSLTTASQS